MTGLSKKIISLGTSVGLVLGGIGLIAAPTITHAATGDVQSFPLTQAGSAPGGMALDTNDNMWIAMSGVNQVGKVTLSGVITTINIPNASAIAEVSGITLGSDNRMWVTEKSGNRIGAINTETNQYQAFNIPSANSQPMGIATGPDGAMWFTEFAANKIGRITRAGVITEFPLPDKSGPTSIVTGPDGALWITLQTGNAIARMTTTGVVTPYPLPTANSAPTDITVGMDNNLWFTERDGNRIGRMTVRGVLAEFALPTADSKPEQITLGASSDLWVTQPGANRLSRITPSGVTTEFILPTANTDPFGIVFGADGNIWFTGKSANNVNRMLTGAVPVPISDPTLSAVNTKTGSTVTADPGSWSFSPTSFTFLWERCAENTTASCQAIPGATNAAYVLTDADAGKFIRVTVKATNLNGVSTALGSSARLSIDGLPPKLPPAPVIGGQSVQLVPGVTATLRAAKAPKRGTSKLFRVIMSNKAVKGKVRMVLINSSGLEVLTIAKGKWINAGGQAKKVKRIPKTLPRGMYSLVATYTPRADQTTTYPVATMEKPLRIR
jgi:virginiamycin B lyase